MMTPNKSSLGERITIERLAHNPYPLFQEMIAHEPVCWVPAFKMWMVTRRADVIELLRDAETYTMETDGGQINPMEDTFGPMMLSIDGVEHKKLRDLFSEPFRARPVRHNYRHLIEQIAQRLVDDIADQNLVDLDKAFSDNLAIYTVVAALGLDVNDIAQFREWYDDFGAAIGNITLDEGIRARGRETYAKFNTLVQAQLEVLRQTPNESVLSHLAHHNVAGLTTEQIVSNVALTFFGGVETATAMLSNTIWALLKHPDQLDAVRRDLSLLPAVVAESLRWESPVQSAMRFPTRDVMLHGVHIKAGEKIYCMLSAANRDPAVFENPDCFDIYRPNAQKHLSFAYGPHYCFGAPLALLEAEVGLSVLLSQLPNMVLHPAYEQAPVGHEFRATPTLFVTVSE